MKKIILLFLSLSSVLMAQPVLTASGINPVVSEMYVFDSNTSVAPGSSGANQNWVFMPTGTNTTSINDTYLPSSTPYASGFTQTNFSYGDGSLYAYFKTSPLVLRYYGYAYSSYSLTYTDPLDLLRFPFSMGDSYSDTWSANVSSGGTQTSTTTVTYDGYGSLTLPNATYNNVARVHLTEVIHYNTNGSVYISNIDYYRWYANGFHQPIAMTYTTTDSFDSYEGSYILSNMVASTSEQDIIASAISSYPNPAVNEINFDLSNVNILTIEIIDIAGKIIYNESLSQSVIDKVLTVNTTDFKDGIYFAKFTNQDGQIGTKKISILK